MNLKRGKPKFFNFLENATLKFHRISGKKNESNITVAYSNVKNITYLTSKV